MASIKFTAQGSWTENVRKLNSVKKIARYAKTKGCIKRVGCVSVMEWVSNYKRKGWKVQVPHFHGVKSRQLVRIAQHSNPNPNQGRIKLFGAPRQWKHFRPLFQAVFLSRGGILTPDWVKHHVSQPQDRNNKYFILYIEFFINNKI